MTDKDDRIEQLKDKKAPFAAETPDKVLDHRTRLPEADGDRITPDQDRPQNLSVSSLLYEWITTYSWETNVALHEDGQHRHGAKQAEMAWLLSGDNVHQARQNRHTRIDRSRAT